MESELPMRHLLITGASGYLGSALVQEIINNPISDLVTLAEHTRKISPISSGLNVSSFAKLVSGESSLESIDAICHLGTLRLEDRNPKRAETIRDFRLFMRQVSNSNAESLTFSSSQAVYGTSGSPWSETSPTIPASDYGWEKLVNEQVLGYASETSIKLRASSLRFPKLCGPGPGFRTSYGEVLNALCSAAFRESKLMLNQAFLKSKFDLMDVRDAARFLAGFVYSPDLICPPLLNLGRGVVVSGGELVQLVSSIAFSEFGKRLKYEVAGSQGQIERYFGMDTQLQSKLYPDFECRPLEQTVLDTLTFIKARSS